MDQQKKTLLTHVVNNDIDEVKKIIFDKDKACIVQSLTYGDLNELYTQSTCMDIEAETHTDIIRSLVKYIPKDLVGRDDEVPKVTVIGHLIDQLAGTPLRLYKNCRSAEQYLRYPSRDLFLWAAIWNRRDLAEVFLQRASERMAGALVAATILESLSQSAERTCYYELAADLQESSSYFENLALDTLNGCYEDSRKMAHHLLTYKLRHWGNTTLFSLANNGRLKDFLSHACCQTKLRDIWLGSMDVHTFDWKIFLGLPLITLPILKIRFLNSGRKENAISRLWSYLTSPVVKCFYHTISYVLFLLLMSEVFMFEMSPLVISSNERMVFFWIFALALEELRQAIATIRAGRGIRGYLSSEWNWIDMQMISIFSAAIGCRILLPFSYFYITKTLYALGFILALIRCLQFLLVSQTLGPQVTMMKGMLKDLMVFLVILFFAMWGFGVVSHFFRYPDASHWNYTVFKRIFFRSYWSIFGELHEDDQADMPENCIAEKADSVCASYMDLEIERFFRAAFVMCIAMVLVNLLIAMFSHTYEQIQEESTKIWRYYRCGLVYEYTTKPWLPPPLNTVILAARLVYFVLNVFDENDVLPYDAQDTANHPTDSGRLYAAEKRVMTSLLTQRDEEESFNDDLRDQVKKLTCVIQELTKNIAGTK